VFRPVLDLVGLIDIDATAICRAALALVIRHMYPLSRIRVARKDYKVSCAIRQVNPDRGVERVLDSGQLWNGLEPPICRQPDPMGIPMGAHQLTRAPAAPRPPVLPTTIGWGRDCSNSSIASSGRSFADCLSMALRVRTAMSGCASLRVFAYRVRAGQIVPEPYRAATSENLLRSCPFLVPTSESIPVAAWSGCKSRQRNDGLKEEKQ
jgi:hypothetical protein